MISSCPRRKEEKPKIFFSKFIGSGKTNIPLLSSVYEYSTQRPVLPSYGRT
jgi:hypothetical protein